jgi:hypothetical protein
MAAVVTRAGASNIANLGQLSLDGTVNYQGYRTLRNSWFAAQSAHGAQIDWYFDGAVTMTNGWYRFWRRFNPPFTNIGLGSGAQSLKVGELGWSSPYEQRIALEITNGIQYQLYLSATNGPSAIPFANSYDADQGSQRWAVSTEWSSGLWWQYVIQSIYLSGNRVKLAVWGFPDGTTPTAKRLYVTGTAAGTPPTINRATSMFYMNQTPMSVTEYENESGLEVSIQTNPWSMPDPLT